MRFFFILPTVLIMLVFFGSTSCLASEKSVNVGDIVSKNVEKSTSEFYKNTISDLTNVYKSQFDFYLNMVKNLIDSKNIIKLFNDLTTFARNEFISFWNSILRYTNLITPRDYK